jgi:hypothetical protein
MIMTHKEAGHDDEEDDFLKTRARVELRVAEDFLACLQARRVIHRTKLRNTPHVSFWKAGISVYSSWSYFCLRLIVFFVPLSGRRLLNVELQVLRDGIQMAWQTGFWKGTFFLQCWALEVQRMRARSLQVKLKHILRQGNWTLLFSYVLLIESTLSNMLTN